MKVEGAIFDLDGTLVDSMYVWDWAPAELVRQLGGNPPEGLARDLREMDLKEAAAYLIDRFHLTCTPETIFQGVNRLVTQEYREQVPMKPGADVLLARLEALGIPCGIATASEGFQARAAMERLGLWRYFQFAISSMEYGSKSKPDLYLEAARRLGSPPERTLVFEDALHAARTAVQAGFLVAGVYDPAAQGDRAEMVSLCRWYLPRLDDAAFCEGLARS
ncbi:MAG: HAD family phosphatase [Lawsonibacter sp.]|nr:HAD family phosphatase [Lawsonibacter sp.]